MNWTDFLSTKNKIKLKSEDFNSHYTLVGIDFGTSTTVVSLASINEAGDLQVEHIRLDQAKFSGQIITDYRISSCVALKKNKLLIGSGAKEEARRLKYGVNYWHSFKMELGTDKGCAYPKSELSENSKSKHVIENPKDVTTLFFKYIKHLIDAYLKKNNLPSKLKYSVTIPASFEANQRLDLMQCLENANIGVEDSCLIDEPNAAFLSYFLNDNVNKDFKMPKDFWPNILVFDFGAGTCDISILQIGETHKGLNVKNISVSQYTEIGGNNIDHYIANEFLLNQMLEQSDKERKYFRIKEITEDILPHLIAFAEKLKIYASEAISNYEGVLDLPTNEREQHTFRISKTKRFNTRLGELRIENPTINLNQFIDASKRFSFDTNFSDIGVSNSPLYSALSKAKLQPKDVNFLLFIGGSSKNVVIRNQVQNALSKAKVLLPQNLQSHVSKGAAIHSLLKNYFDTQIIKPISNQRIFTLLRKSSVDELTVVEAGVELPLGLRELNEFRPQRNGQQVIDIPFFLGDKSKELCNLKIQSKSTNGFNVEDKITLSIEIDTNKILKIRASLNNIDVIKEIENPFSFGGKSLKEKEIQKALKRFNLAAKRNKGKPSVLEYEILARAYEQNNDVLNSAELLEECCDVHHVTKHNRLNCLYSSNGNREKALYYAELALSESPNNTTLLFNFANQFQYKDKAKALEAARKCNKKGPGKPEVMYLLGTLLPKAEGKELINSSYDIFHQKYKNNTLLNFQYSWFAVCARHKNEWKLASEISMKASNKKENKSYDDGNLMSHKSL